MFRLYKAIVSTSIYKTTEKSLRTFGVTALPLHQLACLKIVFLKGTIRTASYFLCMTSGTKLLAQSSLVTVGDLKAVGEDHGRLQSHPQFKIEIPA
jgi:hypothetical protein